MNSQTLRSPMRLAIIDDFADYRNIAAEVIKRMPVKHQIINASASGIEFIQFCSRSIILPDIALLDVQMVGMDGVSTAQFISLFYPQIKIIAVSGHDDRKVIESMVRQGAVGYLLKTGLISKLEFHLPYLQDAIDAALEDRLYIDDIISQYSTPAVTAASINRKALLAKEKQDYEQSNIFQLSEEDRMIVMLKTSNVSNKIISGIIHCSESTVERKLHEIHNKMDVDNSSQMITQAIRFNMVNIAKLKRYL